MLNNMLHIFNKDKGKKATAEKDPDSLEDLEKSAPTEKEILLSNFKVNLLKASSITEIYSDHFLPVKKDDHPLRKHRKNLLHKYGDTDSYKEALEMIMDQSSKFVEVPNTLEPKVDFKTFDECNMWLEMRLEAERAGVNMKSGWPTIHDVKKAAKHLAITEIEKIKSLKELLNLFNKAKDPNNIFMYQVRYLHHEYHEYKHVLLAIAEKANQIISGITDTNNIDLIETVKNVEEIRNELKTYKPQFAHQHWGHTEFNLDNSLCKLSGKELHDDKITDVHYNQKESKVEFNVLRK